MIYRTPTFCKEGRSEKRVKRLGVLQQAVRQGRSN